MTPKDVHIRILRTCDYVTSHGKEDCADVVKLRLLRWGDYPGLSPGPTVVTIILVREGRGIREGDVTLEAEGHGVVGGVGERRERGDWKMLCCWL